MEQKEVMNPWAETVIKEVAKKYSCKAVFDYDSQMLNLEGDTNLAIQAFMELRELKVIEIE